jgi:hypothetical protein
MKICGKRKVEVNLDLLEMVSCRVKTKKEKSWERWFYLICPCTWKQAFGVTPSRPVEIIDEVVRNVGQAQPGHVNG